MPRSGTSFAPQAHLTLRAHNPAPARVELVRKRLSGRILRTLVWLSVCWGSMPVLLWVPPHYPWVAVALLGGSYLAYRSWTGRYAVRSFAGICPRCSAALSLGRQRTIDLPHTLTCYRCHFEPRLEVQLASSKVVSEHRLEHRAGICVGTWETRWLADERFLYCSSCHAGAPATRQLREQAKAENEAAALLARLSGEGRHLI
jgi:hypothetical protein